MSDEPVLTLVPKKDVRTEITEAAQEIPAQIAALAVVDMPSFLVAGTALLRIRGLRQKLNGWMDPQIERATEAKRAAEAARKGLCDDKKLLDDPLQRAEAVLASRIGAYEDACAAAKAAEEARIAQQLAEEAAERLLADAVRLEAEAKAQPDSRLSEALFDEADALLDEPLPIQAVVLASTTPTIPGFSRPKKWVAEVASVDDLLRALLEGKLDKEAAQDLRERLGKILPTPLMNQRAGRLRAAFALPGIVAVEEKGYRLRR